MKAEEIEVLGDDVRPYRLLVKAKNNRLWRAILLQWPETKTQNDAAEKLGMGQGQLGQLLNMKAWPHCQPSHQNGCACRDGWTRIAWRISNAVRDTPDFLFDPVLYGHGPLATELEVTPRQLADAGMLALPPAPDEVFERKERDEALERAISSLTPREEFVIRKCFGLSDKYPETWSDEDLGERFSVTTSRISQIRVKALRKLRHPSRRLRKVLDPTL